jgi:UDP-3-O-[3-hydroxymyristoyl] glucosamine N-acyltransferase
VSLHSLKDLLPLLGEDPEIVGDPEGKAIDHCAPITEATSRSLVWINPVRLDKQKLVEETRAPIVICDPTVELPPGKDTCLVRVHKPKLAFSRVVRALFVEAPTYGVHPSAVISPDAQLAERVAVGPFTYIGNSTIGDGTVIHGHCFIHDGVRIGSRVTIHAGCVIGAEGFGFDRDEDGRLHKLPHIGGVVIEDDVEIQVMSDVDRGTLGDTIIRRGVKIDSFCHIGHNVEIGADTLVAAQAMLGGSLKVGERCWLGPATVYRDWITIGDDAFVGLGALVVKDIAAGEEQMGSPARPVSEYKALLARTRQMLEDD